jgi:GxxExxY protein
MEKDDLTYGIIGCAMKVHRELGSGYQEVIYQRSLALELSVAEILFERELKRDIYYKGVHVGTRRADFVIGNKLIIEIKALAKLDDVHLAQVKNYVVAYNYPRGLLFNFGSSSLQYNLIFNHRYDKNLCHPQSKEIL